MKSKGHILLGVTGSIAAYKAAEIASKLVQDEYTVTCVMTEHAKKFVMPLTFQAITGRKVFSEANHFSADLEGDETFMQLAKEINVFVIAPCTANVIGKIANGIADDLLTTLYLAIRCPVIIAPAMNTRMLEHKTVQENISRLKKLGVNFIEPEEGFLACRDVGKGRLASPEKIVEAIKKASR